MEPWKFLKGRQLYGFFIVEADDSDGVIPKQWHQFAKDTVGEKAIKDSLPHRTKSQRNQIQKAFLGVTTWQRVCNKFKIPLQVLIPKVLE